MDRKEFKEILIYLIRRDLRISDNPILYSLSTQKHHPFTYILPLYIFNAEQLDISGFIPEGDDAKSPYKEPRSQVGGFPRCGPHRSKFLVESVWDLKEELEKLGSGLCIRVGSTSDVIRDLIPQLSRTERSLKVRAIWMVGEEGIEESTEERTVRDACTEGGVDFQLWEDEKYLIDDRDLPFNNIDELPDVFTTYRKTVEPLREHIRAPLPPPEKDFLPGLPPTIQIAQRKPFVIPDTLEGFLDAVLKPLQGHDLIPVLPYPSKAKSAHPFRGGETVAHKRLVHLISSGSASNYHHTQNGLLREDFSTKLSAYLAIGSITARQIHAFLVSLEDGTDPKFESVVDFGKGENKGTKEIRSRLLWRDYMRLCNRKFGRKLFALTGFKSDSDTAWSSPSTPPEGQTSSDVQSIISRFTNGTTGMGLIDASLRELIHTGYTSNRARQNVAFFLARCLKIDWRIGAEWYECMLVDYDLSSNWGNWQYFAGVGNDPRGTARIFNPVKQAFVYDPSGEYVKAWVPELWGLSEPIEIFQAWTMSERRKEELKLKGIEWVEHPLLKIKFTTGRKGSYRGGRGGGDNRGDRGEREVVDSRVVGEASREADMVGVGVVVPGAILGL